MISLTLKGLAKFMVATPANQRKVLRDFKYPKEEGLPQAMYYREARDFIYAFHKNNHPPQWLREQADRLRTLANSSAGQTRSRLANNARPLEAYRAHFSRRRFQILKDLSLSFVLQGVRIKVTPDLHVREGAVEKIIKLEFTVKPPQDRAVRIVSQGMYEAAILNNLQLPSSAVLYIDVPRGRTYKGARAGARMRGELAAACQTIADIWQNL